MLMKLDPSWLMFTVAAVSMISYLLSLGLDAILKEQGFGPFGMSSIISISFIGTILLANEQGIRFSGPTEAALAGLAGAFVVLLTLTVIKALLTRSV
ncbi:hypothetical protein [Nitratireductor indicus]|uniref:Uncharacterized protein n=1 Tax=Nitratireductor indicus C115 TaxID=1231190 RepID=K2NLW5_9HYPH|nr:hypothetical protein [Nitratireductor indicus]EKF40435.1 hypothetical protein NA8A_21092 [Nitratireductor indicus C115]MDS1136322.1 hypothetical protein [Nitratireductor indicus]SFQ77003.1 hypothetical protein SAMN05216176_11441 [Nitratireductor indicus]